MATISIDVAVACNTRNEGKQRVMCALGESFRQVQKVVVLKKFQLHVTGRNMCGSDRCGHLHFKVFFCRNIIQGKVENRVDCIKTGAPGSFMVSTWARCSVWCNVSMMV